MSFFHRGLRYGFAAAILALLLGSASVAGAATDNKKPAPPKTASKASVKPPRPAAGAAHGIAANRGTMRGPSANGMGSRGPTANGGNVRTAGGAHPGVGPGAGSRAPGSVSHAAFRSPTPRGSRTVATRNGAVTRRANGRVSDVHDTRRGIDVHNGLGGGRRVSMERPDHSRVVAERGRQGYAERPYSYHGHDFARRSCYYHGRAYQRYYHGYYYRGAYMNVYAPAVYYGPGFYGWAYNPWAVPISFGWGWGGNPWHGYYGYYFQPYPVYPSAAFWLTDYLISQDLQAEYTANQAAEAAGGPAEEGGQPLLSPEVKQLIADEVRNELALENQEAGLNAQNQDADPGSSGVARLLSDGHPHVFVAGDSVDVVDASSGQECSISDGDVLQLQSAPPPDATSANLVVLASKGGQEGPISSTVTVQLTDLQEMQNRMRENIDQGLQKLQAKQGTGGLPAAPPSAQGQAAPAQYAAVAPPPDPNAGSEIAQVDQQGDQSENELQAEPAQGSGAPPGAAQAAPAAPAATPTVELGQTPDQVQAALGAPSRIANLGLKVIYYFSGMKVTFTNGKVSDVE